MSIEKEIEASMTRAVAVAVEQLAAFVARPVMTRKQLADYWQVEERSITNWLNCKAHPLPVHYVGTAPRFHRVEVDQWSKEGGTKLIEAARDIGIAD